jgi:hypothetical protein
LRTLVFIPAWNESASIEGVIADVRAHIPAADILVVDDGSTDSTAEVARAAGVLVASLPFNQGLGSALQTGYLWALREGYDFCAHLDSDGQHPASEVAEFDGENYQATFTRQIGINVFRLLLTLATRQRFTDTTSSMRAANRRVMKLFSEDYSPDFAEIESLQLAVRQGLRVEEVPVRMLERTGGASFLTPLRSAGFIFKGLLVILVGMFKPRHAEAER